MQDISPTPFDKNLIAYNAKTQEKIYWTDRFSLERDECDFLSCYPGFLSQESGAYQCVDFSLEQPVVAKLEKACANDQSLYVLLMAVFFVQLSKANRVEAFAVGSMIEKGDHTTDMINELFPVIVSVTSNLTFRELLHIIKEAYLEATENADYPVQHLMDNLSDGNGQKLFNTAIIMEGLHELHRLLDHGQATFILNFNHTSQELTCSATYKNNVFTKSDVERIIHDYQTVLNTCLAYIDLPLKNISVLNDTERQYLLHNINDVQSDYPKHKGIPELFEAHALSNPNTLAIEGEDFTFSYKTLNEASSRVAHYLQTVKGIRQGDFIGILLDREQWMMPVILGILKAGGAYVPVDPTNPGQRIVSIIRDANLSLLITRDEFLGENINSLVDVVTLDSVEEEINTLEPVYQSTSLTGDDPVYVMYTSGSSGKPKGTQISHANVTRVVLQTNYIDIQKTDRVLQLSNYAFDGSVFDIYGALLNGATLLMISTAITKDVPTLGIYIREQNVTVSFCTTALFNALVDGDLNNLKSIRKLLFGGERVSLKHLNRAFDHLGPNKLIHVYGPTESTVFATYYPVDQLTKQWTTIPIGRPVANTEIYILDKDRMPVALGVPGEIAISGDGLSSGYLNNEELTQSKFIDHPFIEGQKLYLTGDLAKWLPEKQIEFIGRTDQQIKVRGFRIEPGEIESQMLAHEKVKEAKVVVKADDGDKQLVAYYVAESELDQGQLKAFLSHWLPGYMVPLYYVKLQALPLTINGKIDHKALPVPQTLHDGNIKKPSNTLEKELATIWSQLLSIDIGEISTEHSFFELGGHSLKASAMINTIHKVLNIKVPVSEVFKNPTIASLAKHMEALGDNDYLNIPKADIRTHYPVTAAQKRLLDLHQLDPQSLAYNIPQFLLLKGAIDTEKFANAFKQLIARHESLRTGFEMVEGKIVQKIIQEIDAEIDCFDAKMSQEEITQQFIRPFSLNQPPLIRIGLAELADGNHLFMTDMHHCISDGVSQGILIKDFIALYDEQKLAPLNLQYKDFAVWQEENLTENSEAQRNFWRNEFNELPDPLELPADFHRAKLKSFKGSSMNFEISAIQSQKLSELAHKEGVTMYMLLISIYYVFLSKLSGQDDIVVGNPIAGREHRDLENIIGMFVNTIPVRSRVDSDLTFRQFLSQIKIRMPEYFENQSYPYEKLMEELGADPGISRNALFDVAFGFNSFDENTLKIDGLAIEPIDPKHKISKFDLTLSVIEQEDHLLCNFEYSTVLFQEETIHRFIAFFHQLTASITHDPSRKLGSVEMIDDKEKTRLLQDLNLTETPYPKQKTLSELFEIQVQQTPGSIAIKGDGFQLTYHELQVKANKIACYLVKEEKVLPGDFVGLMLGSEEYLIPCMLGILKAGAAYVPIDPEYPQDRVIHILADVSVEVIITRKDYLSRLDQNACHVLTLDEKSELIETMEPLHELAVGAGKSTAYVMYTSGSTGKPKGAVISHSNVSRVVKNTNYIAISDDDVMIQSSNVAFDGSVFDIFGALLNGATLILVSPEVVKDVRKLGEVICSEKVTVLFLTTALFNTLADHNLDSLKGIRKLLTGGEQSSIKHMQKVLAALGPGKLVHIYGPTESTVFSIFHPVDHIDDSLDAIPIGKPISNTQVYILDQNFNPSPSGITGEIYIGGDGVANGYLNQKELTEKRFIDLPNISTSRLYRTGDLARWLPNDNIHFVGRADNQVKIRGFRIELEEIEKELQAHADINEAVVLVKGTHNDKCLLAYYTGQEVNKDMIITSLSEKLPGYMIPLHYTWLKQMPLNSNGKIDRKKLPDPSVEQNQEVVKPSNKTESKLLKIWAEVLDLPAGQISAEHDFFVIGGHSLRVVSLVMKIQETFAIEITMEEVWSGPTIRQMSECIDNYLWIKGNPAQEETSTTEFI
ncbi:amino acid adenylation domain-containing protein [Fulvivirga sp. M361]|uniref:non-ribosomal peptide synthetase n=1 Tax=Fulvivirga sp. M361 TaxID=2594266 RepID=UPI00117B2FDA|nr:non-ribosomal peptide synthetase [Fulvivirga sp. M361]TRX53347.1 amino acid adenylation domain-containing protein [Fulvivirga sp. M361]